MKYFTNVSSLDELKKEYRLLVMLHHPDKGGSTATMQAINNEHDELFEILKAQQNRRADADETGRTRRVDEMAEEFREILEILIKLDGLNIELCGSWLWISGETKKHKDSLKAAACRWSNNKKMWYWHPTQAPGGWRRGGSYSIDDIRAKYGSEPIVMKNNPQIA
jgi:curved DNA-binding protein CbpA